MKKRISALAIMMLTVTILTNTQSSAQINNEAHKEYFLIGRFGEVCTMCEVVVLCEAGTQEPTHAGVPDRGNFTLYHLNTRTFWSQISTIWEYFISNLTTASLEKRGHGRPADVYTIIDGVWGTQETIEARLILDPAVIELDNTKINRVNREWLSATSDQSLGYCQSLPLWGALETISQNTSADD